jgi:hypothetical protein
VTVVLATWYCSTDALAVTKTIDLVFASNIDDPSSGTGCRLPLKDDCDLWHAVIEWDHSTDDFTVTELNELADSTTYGELFPSLFMLDQSSGEFIVNYTRYDESAGGTPYLRYSIETVSVDLGEATPVVSVEVIEHAQFADLEDEGNYLAWTQLGMTGQQSVYRATLDGTYESQTPAIIFSNTGFCDYDAASPKFLGTNGNYIVYHCPSGSDGEAKLIQRTLVDRVPTNVDRTANEVMEDCGHFSTTYDNDWAACSSNYTGNHSKIFAYDVTLDGGIRTLNELDEDNILLQLTDTEYDGYSSEYGDCVSGGTNYIKQSYANYGNSSSEMVWTAWCNDDNLAEISKIFIGYADPADGVMTNSNDVFYLSGLIEEYLVDNTIVDENDIPYLDFMTADMYIE